jgi:hypothetical protein
LRLSASPSVGTGAGRQGLRNVKLKTAWSMEIGTWRQEG